MRRAVCGLIRLYQVYVSPLMFRSCKYIPSCSQYALESVHKYGVLKGMAMGAWRILRCNPFSKGGYDPVP